MGMFDNIRCKYPLPVPGADDLDFQTKDTDAQFMDQYEIREDGTLWHEDYDTEDQSERGKWLAANPGKRLPEEIGMLMDFGGCMTRVNKRWEQVVMTGEIKFHTTLDAGAGGVLEFNHGWIEFSACFEEGKVARMNLLQHRKPKENEVT